ncbi:hypothetical protein CR513_46470, partial [Mucuna pruriens]
MNKVGVIVKSTNRVDTISEATRCQPASTNPTSQNLWNMHFCGAPNRHVPPHSEIEISNATIPTIAATNTNT